MGNWKAVPRKPRKHPAILRNSKAFSDALHKRNAELAASIAFATTLEVLGVEGLMRLIKRAINTVERMKIPKGLI